MEQKAETTLPDLLAVPPYEEELGFVHHVEADVQRVLSALEASRPGVPLVIFRR